MSLNDAMMVDVDGADAAAAALLEAAAMKGAEEYMASWAPPSGHPAAASASAAAMSSDDGLLNDAVEMAEAEHRRLESASESASDSATAPRIVDDIMFDDMTFDLEYSFDTSAQPMDTTDFDLDSSVEDIQRDEEKIAAAIVAAQVRDIDDACAASPSSSPSSSPSLLPLLPLPSTGPVHLDVLEVVAPPVTSSAMSVLGAPPSVVGPSADASAHSQSATAAPGDPSVPLFPRRSARQAQLSLDRMQPQPSMMMTSGSSSSGTRNTSADLSDESPPAASSSSSSDKGPPAASSSSSSSLVYGVGSSRDRRGREKPTAEEIEVYHSASWAVGCYDQTNNDLYIRILHRTRIAFIDYAVVRNLAYYRQVIAYYIKNPNGPNLTAAVYLDGTKKTITAKEASERKDASVRYMLDTTVAPVAKSKAKPEAKSDDSSSDDSSSQRSDDSSDEAQLSDEHSPHVPGMCAKTVPRSAAAEKARIEVMNRRREQDRRDKDSRKRERKHDREKQQRKLIASTSSTSSIAPLSTTIDPTITMPMFVRTYRHDGFRDCPSNVEGPPYRNGTRILFALHPYSYSIGNIFKSTRSAAYQQLRDEGRPLNLPPEEVHRREGIRVALDQLRANRLSDSERPRLASKVNPMRYNRETLCLLHRAGLHVFCDDLELIEQSRGVKWLSYALHKTSWEAFKHQEKMGQPELAYSQRRAGLKRVKSGDAVLYCEHYDGNDDQEREIRARQRHALYAAANRLKGPAPRSERVMDAASSPGVSAPIIGTIDIPDNPNQPTPFVPKAPAAPEPNPLRGPVERCTSPVSTVQEAMRLLTGYDMDRWTTNSRGTEIPKIVCHMLGVDGDLYEIYRKPAAFVITCRKALRELNKARRTGGSVQFTEFERRLILEAARRVEYDHDELFPSDAYYLLYLKNEPVITDHYVIMLVDSILHDGLGRLKSPIATERQVATLKLARSVAVSNMKQHVDDVAAHKTARVHRQSEPSMFLDRHEYKASTIDYRTVQAELVCHDLRHHNLNSAQMLAHLHFVRAEPEAKLPAPVISSERRMSTVAVDAGVELHTLADDCSEAEANEAFTNPGVALVLGQYDFNTLRLSHLLKTSAEEFHRTIIRSAAWHYPSFIANCLRFICPHLPKVPVSVINMLTAERLGLRPVSIPQSRAPVSSSWSSSSSDWFGEPPESPTPPSEDPTPSAQPEPDDDPFADARPSSSAASSSSSALTARAARSAIGVTKRKRIVLPESSTIRRSRSEDPVDELTAEAIRQREGFESYMHLSLGTHDQCSPSYVFRYTRNPYCRGDLLLNSTQPAVNRMNLLLYYGVTFAEFDRFYGRSGRCRHRLSADVQKNYHQYFKMDVETEATGISDSVLEPEYTESVPLNLQAISHELSTSAVEYVEKFGPGSEFFSNLSEPLQLLWRRRFDAQMNRRAVSAAHDSEMKKNLWQQSGAGDQANVAQPTEGLNDIPLLGQLRPRI